MGRRWRPNHRVVASSTQNRASKETILARPWRNCTKSGRMSRKLGIGEIFHHQIMSGNIDDSQDHIDIAWAVGHFFNPQVKIYHRYYVRGFAGSTCSKSFPEGTCHFQPPEHVPRTSARAQNLRAEFGRALCVPRSRVHEKRPAAGREIIAEVPKKTHLYIVI